MAILTAHLGRSSTLKGSTGTAFTLALQTSVAQVSGVIGPQLFRSKWAYNGYKVSFGICAAAIIVGLFANCYTWYLTRNVEWDVCPQGTDQGREAGADFFRRTTSRCFTKESSSRELLRKGRIMKLLEAPMVYFSDCQHSGPLGIFGRLSQGLSKK
jgi:hypothetical protein